MADDIAKLLYEGALAVTQGRRVEAQTILMRVLELDEHNEQAWLWLSGAVEQPADQEIALENVLALNPHNAAAQEGLRVLHAQTSAAHSSTTEWQPPVPQESEEAVELHCWQCSSSLYSVAQFCWQCHAPVHACNKCIFRMEQRCKELQGLTNALLQAGGNECPWWRAAA